MKKILSLMLSSALYASMLSATTQYENAEDKEATRWRVYDQQPAGAKILNHYDEERKSQVIELHGEKVENGYILGDWENSKNAWNNQTEKTITWSMKYSEYFVVYIRVMTTQGAKYIYYTSSDEDRGVSPSGEYIHLGLGSKANNGTWQTFSRDLEADLQKYEKENKILAVNAFLIRGNGLVDDIQLSQEDETQQEEEPTTPTPYTPNPLSENILKDEAMNMLPDHPKFEQWRETKYIVDGHLELVGKYADGTYDLPNSMGKAHHKYTLVWDMETTGEVEQSQYPTVRITLFDYLQGGFQNSQFNKKETLYAVVISDDKLPTTRQTLQMSRRDDFNKSTISISNIRVYDGVVELAKPNLKESHFKGYTSMDKNGVFRRNGKVIFPINIYKDNVLLTQGKRTVEQYLNQGITGAIMEAVSEYWQDASEDRVSTIINRGMSTVSIPISNYLKNPNYTINSANFKQFKRAITKLKAQPEIWQSIGVLSIDNEFYHQTDQFKESMAEIRRLIPDKPIQMLNGNEGISAWYNDYVDITGTYIANDHKADNKEIQEGTSNIHQLESQRLTPSLNHPATLLQINQGTNLNFGSILMAGVAIGGTKLEYWKDSLTIRKGFRNLDMLNDPIWKQLPIAREYLDKMCDLGIIESTPYIGFKIEQTNDTYEYIKARYGKKNKAYIIASNMTPMTAERSTVFNQSYKGLHYQTTGKLKDIITGETKGTIDAKTHKVKITLAPHEWVVLEVE